jgi:acetyl-CoA C-acetyltransferase
MRDVVIVDAVRTPVGRRNGGLSTMHSADLLGVPFKALFERTGVDPNEVGQVVGGCVDQIGMQAFNVARTAWLAAGPSRSPPARSTPSAAPASRRPTWRTPW